MRRSESRLGDQPLARPGISRGLPVKEGAAMPGETELQPFDLLYGSHNNGKILKTGLTGSSGQHAGAHGFGKSEVGGFNGFAGRKGSAIIKTAGTRDGGPGGLGEVVVGVDDSLSGEAELNF